MRFQQKRSTKEVLLIAISNTAVVDFCLSSIIASYHLLSSIKNDAEKVPLMYKVITQYMFNG